MLDHFSNYKPMEQMCFIFTFFFLLGLVYAVYLILKCVFISLFYGLQPGRYMACNRENGERLGASMGGRKPKGYQIVDDTP